MVSFFRYCIDDLQWLVGTRGHRHRGTGIGYDDNSPQKNFYHFTQIWFNPSGTDAVRLPTGHETDAKFRNHIIHEHSRRTNAERRKSASANTSKVWNWNTNTTTPQTRGKRNKRHAIYATFFTKKFIPDFIIAKRLKYQKWCTQTFIWEIMANNWWYIHSFICQKFSAKDGENTVRSYVVNPYTRLRPTAVRFLEHDRWNSGKHSLFTCREKATLLYAWNSYESRNERNRVRKPHAYSTYCILRYRIHSVVCSHFLTLQQLSRLASKSSIVSPLGSVRTWDNGSTTGSSLNMPLYRTTKPKTTLDMVFDANTYAPDGR